MRRPSMMLFDLGSSIWNTVGFGNTPLVLTFIATLPFSLVLLSSLYFPALAASINWILGITMGLGVFGAIGLMAKCGMGGLILGALFGLGAAFLSIALCTFGAYVAPAIGGILLLPNIIAGVSCLLGGISLIPETIFLGIYNCISSCCNCLTGGASSDYYPPSSPAQSQPRLQTSSASIQKQFGGDSDPQQYGTPAPAYSTSSHPADPQRYSYSCPDTGQRLYFATDPNDRYAYTDPLTGNRLTAQPQPAYRPSAYSTTSSNQGSRAVTYPSHGLYSEAYGQNQRRPTTAPSQNQIDTTTIIALAAFGLST